jgi:type VII secretion integral membrane protein EccD
VTTTAGEDLARVTVISPTRRIDLALPGSTTLGELLPTIVRFAGFDGATSQEAIHAWVLQRLGEDPLDPNKKVSALNIRDGETLHLRQRESTMPDAAFDDVVDAVTTATSTRPSWVSAHSQWFAVVALTALLVVVPLMGLWRADTSVPFGGLPEAALTAFLAIVAAVGSIVLSRAFGHFLPAAGLGWAADILIGAAGLFILPAQAMPLRVLIASALVLVMAATIWLAARVQPYAQLAVVISSVLILIATTAMVLLNGRIVEVSAVAIALILAVTSFLPSLSYQLARVAMPNLPTTAEALMADDQPVQSDIVARAISADRVLGAFLTASGVTVTLLMVPVLQRADWIVVALGIAVSLAMMLRARAFVGRTQRLALLLPGALIGFAAVVMALMALPFGWRLGVSTLAVLFGGLALATYASVMFSRIVSPTYGRIGDILEWIGIMAIVPLVLAVLDVYLTVSGWAAGK